MNSAQLTTKQAELKAAIEARNCTARWWFGNSETRLYVERKNDKVYLTFDDAAQCFGAKVNQADGCKKALLVDRIAFYEALRVGNPESLAAYMAEVDAFNAANENNDDVELMWAGDQQ